MTLQEFQKQCAQTATYPSAFFPYFNLVGDVGSLYSKFSILFEGDNVADDEAMKKDIKAILWDLSQICDLRGYSLEDIASESDTGASEDTLPDIPDVDIQYQDSSEGDCEGCKI